MLLPALIADWKKIKFNSLSSLSLSAVELYILGSCVIDTTYDGKAVRLWKREEALRRTQSLECTLSIMGSCQNGYLIYKASWTLSLSPFSSIKVANHRWLHAERRWSGTLIHMQWVKNDTGQKLFVTFLIFYQSNVLVDNRSFMTMFFQHNQVVCPTIMYQISWALEPSRPITTIYKALRS